MLLDTYASVVCLSVRVYFTECSQSERRIGLDAGANCATALVVYHPRTSREIQQLIVTKSEPPDDVQDIRDTHTHARASRHAATASSACHDSAVTQTAQCPAKSPSPSSLRKIKPPLCATRLDNHPEWAVGDCSTDDGVSTSSTRRVCTSLATTRADPWRASCLRRTRQTPDWTRRRSCRERSGCRAAAERGSCSSEPFSQGRNIHARPVDNRLGDTPREYWPS